MNTQDSDETLPPRRAAIKRLLGEIIPTPKRLRIGRIVAQGGMGTIYEAEEASTNRQVAMKVMREGRENASVSRFVAEARITAALEHPNIVPVHELGVDELDQPYYTMKYVQGETLEQCLKGLKRRDPKMLQSYTLPQLLTIFQKICDAIAFAHSRDIIHRDLKPANIMLGPFGEVLVMDWGLAKSLRAAPTGTSSHPAVATANAVPTLDQTRDGQCFGTPEFMAPEQAQALNSEVGPHTDIYALGAILYSIVTLSRPVSGRTAEEVLQNVSQGRINRSCSSLMSVPHIPGGQPPPALLAVAFRAMSLQPVNRYQSVAELQEEISAFQGGFATQAEGATLTKQLALAVRRHRREAMIVGLAMLVVIAVACVAFQHIDSERDRARNALDELRKAAPLYASQARTLAAQERIDQALDQLNYALTLRPGDVDDLLLKANLLQSQLRISEASNACAEALRAQPNSTRVRTQLDLCNEILRESQGQNLSDASLNRLLHAMVVETRPVGQLIPALRALGVDSYLAHRLTYDKGGLALNLSNSKFESLPFMSVIPLHSLDLTGSVALRDVQALQGLPLTELRLFNTAVTDLAPLRHMPLEYLDLRMSPVSDLSPLADIPLRELYLYGSQVTDFTLLKQFTSLEVLDLAERPIQDLSLVPTNNLRLLRIGHTRVRDLSPLAGSKLEIIHFDSVDVTDVRPLLNCRRLKWIVLPNSVKDFQCLRDLPQLERISFSWSSESRPDQSAAEFWAQYPKPQ